MKLGTTGLLLYAFPRSLAWFAANNDRELAYRTGGANLGFLATISFEPTRWAQSQASSLDGNPVGALISRNVGFTRKPLPVPVADPPRPIFASKPLLFTPPVSYPLRFLRLLYPCRPKEASGLAFSRRR